MDITVSSFDKIEDSWQSIDQTFYQQAQWNGYVDRQTRHTWRFRLGLKANMFVTASADGRIVAILPVRVTPLSRKIEFISWRVSGLNDLCASSDPMVEQAAAEIVKFLKQRFGGYKFKFYDMPATSPLVKALTELCTVTSNKPRGSFHIPLANYADYDAWFKSLSSHQRQNLRTLYNHVARDNRQVSLRIFSRENLPEKDYLKKVWTLYALRKTQWRKRGNGLFGRLNVAFNVRKEMKGLISRSLSRLEAARMFTLEVDGTLMAFLFCYCDPQGRIIVPKLAIHPDYARESPGGLLLCETMKWCYQHGIRDFDLSRGDEPYKRRFGGTEETIVRLRGTL